MNNVATREVCRALSESRAIAIWCGLAVCSHVAWFALLAGNAPLVMVGATLTFGFFIAMCAHVEPYPPRGPKGAIAKMSEADFECLLQFVEQEAEILAGGGAAASDAPTCGRDDDSFACLVAEALDELPAFLREELERYVAVVISNDGASHGCYGLYMGGTVAYRGWADRIVIFRDTLTRDFGSDPNVLRRKVRMVVEHELAHHLGASEAHVTRLGLSDTTRPRDPKPCHGRLRAVLPNRYPPVALPAGRRSTRGSSRSREPVSHADAVARRPPAASRRVRKCERCLAGASCPDSRARPPPGDGSGRQRRACAGRLGLRRARDVQREVDRSQAVSAIDGSKLTLHWGGIAMTLKGRPSVLRDLAATSIGDVPTFRSTGSEP